MTDLSFFEYRRCPHEFEKQGGCVLRFQPHVNAHFLAVALQDYARSQGCRAWADDLEDDGVYSVWLWDGRRHSAFDVIEQFGAMVGKVLNDVPL